VPHYRSYLSTSPTSTWSLWRHQQAQTAQPSRTPPPPPSTSSHPSSAAAPRQYQKRFVFRSIKTNEEIVTVPNTKVQAVDTRDALCKALYGRLFDWIVARINESFTSSASQQKNFIGILDIFGFEFFETNSFEQLCINYANEMLQNQFNAFVFQLERIRVRRRGHPLVFDRVLRQQTMSRSYRRQRRQCSSVPR